jgi:hypothetical protein
MTNDDAFMDDERAGDAVARYLEDNPELLRDIVPVHDLWPAIESRISARVIPISARPTHGARRSLGWMPMLAAASALIAASAGITYVLTTRAATQGTAPGRVASTATQRIGTEPRTTTPDVQPQQAVMAVAHNDVPDRTKQDTPASDQQQRGTTQLASHAAGYQSDDMRRTYNSEITTLHAALDARRGQLNPATVKIIEQNLSVIDEAIRQSKEALAKDPNSRLLNDQLDHSLATKTSLLRVAALLPAA